MDVDTIIDWVWDAWRGQVASAEDLAACVGALGVLPLAAPAPWPALAGALAPGVTLPAAWAWAGVLVDRREIFSGRVLPGLASGCLAALPVFVEALAREPGSDPGRAYAANRFGITAKAVVDLLRVRGPLTLQQIRLGLGQHKRFLIHDTPQAMAELERALVVLAVGPDYVAGVRPERGPAPPGQAAGVGRGDFDPRRYIPAPNPAIDLRAWELTIRWAPPALLAAADRLREQPGEARAHLRARLAALNPHAAAPDIDTLLGEDIPHEPATTPTTEP